MAQFDLFRNPSSASKGRAPFLLDVQSDLLDPLATRVVVPLAKPDATRRKAVERLNPTIEVEGKRLVMLTQELAAVPRAILGASVGNASRFRGDIIAALDLLITGI
ncbi:MAG: CcdB family protein [Burkholderiales bacterium]